jgi:glycosyltransferase involved in cell wall biosynthesis
MEPTFKIQKNVRPHICRPKEDDEEFISNKINPKVSIISPSYNHGQFIEETILTIARQSYKDFEHIIMDGGSTDETIEIVKKYPHVTFYSEKDSGPCDAFNKGMKIAKGDFVLMSCVSDGLLDEDWLKMCVSVLESDEEVSLVWGLPQYLSEDGYLGDVCYSNFMSQNPPQKFDWFDYWSENRFWFPEGNFIARKNVYMECFPKDDFDKTIEPCLEFNFNFNSKGYLPYFIGVVANFGRTHSNQMGQQFSLSGMSNRHMNDYQSKCDSYLSQNSHFFRNGQSSIIKKNIKL